MVSPHKSEVKKCQAATYLTVEMLQKRQEFKKQVSGYIRALLFFRITVGNMPMFKSEGKPWQPALHTVTVTAAGKKWG